MTPAFSLFQLCCGFLGGTPSAILALQERTWWTHDLSPEIIRFTDTIAIRWYGLAYLVGALVGWWLMRRFVRQGRMPTHLGEVEDFVLYGAFLPMFLGGRIGYCLLYGWDRLVEDPRYIYRVWEGGMASHGGMIGLALGVAFWAWRKQRSTLALFDAICATAPVGVFLGRIANFINGELWGRPTEVAWAVIFPEATRLVDGTPTPRHPSQLYEALLEGLLVFVVANWVHKKTRRPGLTTGVATMTYALVRVFGEFFREPDEGYELFFGWMSKGQLFSIPLFLFGVVLAVNALRKGPQPEKFLPPEIKKGTTTPMKGRTEKGKRGRNKSSAGA